jgi:hypothetical protein
MTLTAINMITPTYDPKAGWSNLTQMFFGTIPKYEDFSERFKVVCPEGKFSFKNDSRVGNWKHDCEGLWDELIQATQEWEEGYVSKESSNEEEAAGLWCKKVLQQFGYEWI